jgi:hypothetical protein
MSGLWVLSYSIHAKLLLGCLLILVVFHARRRILISLLESHTQLGFLLRPVAKFSLNLFGSFHGAKLSLEISLSSYIEEDLLAAFCLLQFELCVCVCTEKERHKEPENKWWWCAWVSSILIKTRNFIWLFLLSFCVCVQQKKRKKFHKLGASISFSSFCFACF